MKILVLGASGMLGHSLLHRFSQNGNHNVIGSVRNKNNLPKAFLSKYEKQIIDSIDVYNFSSVEKIITEQKPDIVINAIGLIRQKKGSYIDNIYINALFPHKVAEVCEKNNARFIEIATDCVFDGKLKEGEKYTEETPSNCTDLYGKTKFLGEVIDMKNSLTIRTSIIGHELKGNYSLIDWFLSQNNEVSGYTRAFYSGMPTCSLAKVILNIVENYKELSGLWQITSNPITKYDLLQLVNRIYNKNIKINKNTEHYCNHIMSYEKIQKAIGYQPFGWEDMIKDLHNDYANTGFYNEK